MTRTEQTEVKRSETEQQRRIRWRLVMGVGSEQMCGDLEEAESQQEQCLGFLYDREYGEQRNVRLEDRRGGLDDTALTVPDWINQVHQLFPRETVERLEMDALERYQLDEMVTNADVLMRAQPSQSLMKAVLRTRHLMNQDVLRAAQHLVRQAIDELMRKLADEVHNAFQGALDRRRRTRLKIAKNFDIAATLHRNLQHYDAELQRVMIRTPYFYSRVCSQVDRWQFIILVDESASMLDSVIHSAVTAAIFHGLQIMKVHLCIFDTAVVDLTQQVTDPVQTLMQIQLGGGTDIGQALAYAAQLVENPSRTIVAVISDFYEGGPMGKLFANAKRLIDDGVTCLGLAALDEQADPTYDHDVAARLVHLGWHVAAMTPGELAEWVAEKVRR